MSSLKQQIFSFIAITGLHTGIVALAFSSQLNYSEYCFNRCCADCFCVEYAHYFNRQNRQSGNQRTEILTRNHCSNAGGAFLRTHRTIHSK